MRRITLAAVALSAAAGMIPPSVVASPPTNGPRGRLCSYSATMDPSPEAGDDRMTGQINGGPLIGEPGGELICTLQVNSNVHSGPDTVVRSSGPADWTGVSFFVSGVEYMSPADAQDYLCTSYREPDGWTLYWIPTDSRGTLDPSDDTPGHWTWNPDRPCMGGTLISTRPIFEAIDALVFCPILRSAHHTLGFHRAPEPSDGTFIDNEGDIFIDGNENGVSEAEADQEWWFDCPVYIEDGADAFSGPGIIDFP